MKFSFCGGLDCPDWLLAEIAAMASISAVKVKQISAKVTTQLCVCPFTNVFANQSIILQASSLILHPDTSTQLVAELCEETKLSAEVRMRIMMIMMIMMMMMMQTCSALLAAVCWILRGGAGNSLDHGQLHAELLQLGTPR